jgi:hypothetical protein
MWMWECEESMTHEIQSEVHDLIMTWEQEFEIDFFKMLLTAVLMSVIKGIIQLCQNIET